MRPLFWGFILLLFGVLLLLQNFDLLSVGDVISTWWPALLILWGWSVMRRHTRARKVETAGTGGTGLTQELVQESHVFDNVYCSVHSKDFKGGSISTVFGNTVVDLRASGIAQGTHEFRLHSVFGDSVVTIPRGMAFTLTVNTLVGTARVFGQRRGGFASEAHIASEGYAEAPARLAIVISKIFGDLNIDYAS